MATIIDGSTGIITQAIDLTTPLTSSDGGNGLSSAGSAGNILISNGTNWSSSPRFTYVNPIALTGQSLVSISTTIPSWARRITLLIAGMSSTGASADFIVQIGTSSGLDTTATYTYMSQVQSGGTVGGQAGLTATGYTIRSNDAAKVYDGIATLFLADPSTNKWIFSTNLGHAYTGNGADVRSTGVKSLSGALTRVSVGLNLVDTFDGGTVALTYE